MSYLISNKKLASRNVAFAFGRIQFDSEGVGEFPLEIDLNSILDLNGFELVLATSDTQPNDLSKTGEEIKSETGVEISIPAEQFTQENNENVSANEEPENEIEDTSEDNPEDEMNEEPVEEEPQNKDGLYALTNKQLKRKAAELKIDVSKLNKKEDFVKAITEATKAE